MTYTISQEDIPIVQSMSNKQRDLLSTLIERKDVLEEIAMLQNRVMALDRLASAQSINLGGNEDSAVGVIFRRVRKVNR